MIQPGLTCLETGHKHETPIEQPVTGMRRCRRQDLSQDSYPIECHSTRLGPVA